MSIARIQPDQPQTGLFKRRLVKDGAWVPVKIWYGAPLDPDTGEELDRSPRWQALEGDRPSDDVPHTWLYSCDHPIDKAEYDYLMALGRYSVAHDPESPEARSHKPIDLHRLKPVF